MASSREGKNNGMNYYSQTPFYKVPWFPRVSTKMVKSTPMDMDAKSRSTDVQFSEITRAIYSLSSDKDELSMEQQVLAMWNDWHLIIGKRL
jgi:hypothetical protein